MRGGPGWTSHYGWCPLADCRKSGRWSDLALAEPHGRGPHPLPGDDLDLAALGVAGREGEQALALGGDGIEVVERYALQRLDLEGRRIAGADDLPEAADHAVDEQRRPPELRDDLLSVCVVDDPRAIGVGDEDVVELGQEAWRRGRAGIGQRGVGQVEELAAGLVAEGAQPRAQPL